MDLPRLSVVVPNYNHASYLTSCLNALLGQSAQPFEVIVIDDASTDNSMEILKRYELGHANLRVYQNERNRGVVYGMNRGLQLATGDYITFPAADDEVVPGLFEKSLRLLAEFPQAALSCTVCEWRYVDSGLTVHAGMGIADRPCYLSPDEMVRVAKEKSLLIVTSSSVMRKEALRGVGGFIPELRWHCDWFAAFTSGFRHGICYVPEVLSWANILPRSYYQSGHKRVEHRQVLVKLVELLNSPAYADVRPRIRDSGALSLFAMPMLRLLMSKPEYRYFINATLVRKTFQRSAELVGKRILPGWLARWVLDHFYRFEKAPTK